MCNLNIIFPISARELASGVAIYNLSFRVQPQQSQSETLCPNDNALRQNDATF